MVKVFINPGHSENAIPDAGCCYNGIKEALICKELSLLVKSKLELNGILTELYQQCGTNLSSNQQLNEVPKVANKSGADIFVSIHMNGFTDENAKGAEILYSKGSVKGQKLATCIQSELVKSYSNYQFVNRGAKVDSRGLLVLRATSMPAVLIEVGFISNKSEATFIKNNLDSIANRICLGICNYFDIAYKSNNSSDNIEVIKLVHTENDLYDLYINEIKVLSQNRYNTCLKYLETNHKG